MVSALAGRTGKIGGMATLLKVFLPYLVWNTVFDNTRVVAELGRKPALFSQYCHALLRFSRQSHFQYSYRPWPPESRASGPSQMLPSEAEPQQARAAPDSRR
jgi:hypothetical protein